MTETVTNDAVAQKIKAIQEEIEKKNREAENLLSYLIEQQNVAKEEEELEEENLKRQGIIVGQHIPSLPSKLNLDPSQLAEFENFSSTLLVARELITQNRTNFLRRTGNLPVSEVAEARREANQKYLSQLDPEKPHYLQQTKSAKVREDRNTVRFGETIQEVKKMTKTGKDETTASSLVRKSKEIKPVLTTKERIENENVIKGLQHKMNYLRNPRNNPNSVTKMLVKPKDFLTKPPLNPEESEAQPNVDFANSQDLGDEHTANSSISERLKNKYSKYIKLNNNPLFVAEPKSIYFMDYEIGVKYTKNVSFKNVSAVSRSVRILPPKSKLFTISPLKYPPNCANGIIAPGMAVSTTLTFIPNSLGDYEEFIQVHTEAGSTQVQIIAQREPPNLDLPNQINFGSILVGDAQRSVVSCSNIGGFANFTIVEDDDPEECENLELNQFNKECLRIPPFTVYPSTFSLHKGESIDLVFELVPLQLGVLTRNYKIICDNGQVKSYTICANSKEINLSTTDINDVAFNDKDPNVYRDLYFHNLVASAENHHMVSVVNDTGISIEYEWVWVDIKLPQNDWNRVGQDLIVKREQHNHPFPELHQSPSELTLPIIGLNTEAAVVDEKLLRSLKETLHHDSDSAVKGNSVKEGPYEILPARGVLAGEGAAEFKFIYNPRHKDNSSLRAIMMIKSIPIAAMPTHPEQAKFLHLLALEGHGKYPRLRSWLEEIGVMGKVVPYRKPTGNIWDEKKLIPLTQIINLIYSHMNEEENERIRDIELPRLNRWIRNILQHVFGIRKRDALSADSVDGSASLSANNSSYLSQATVDTSRSKLDEQLLEIAKPKSEETIELFDWKADAPNSPPLLLPELVLKYEEESSGHDEDVDENESDDESIVEVTDNGMGKTLRELAPTEQQMCDEVYVDIFNTIKILGEYISSELDFKVSHEAIDYLKECSYTHLSSISFLVHGQSNPQKLLLSPPNIRIGGNVILGSETEIKVTLINPNDSGLQIFFDKQSLIIRRKLTTSLHDEVHEDLEKAENVLIPSNNSASEASLESLIENIELNYSQDALLLMPHTQETITIRMKIMKLGHFEILLPVRSVDTTALLETIVIDALVVGAKLRFNTAEVDIGLLGVGGENSYSLSFSNEGDVPLMFMMKPTIHVDNIINNPSGVVAAAGAPVKRGSMMSESGRETGRMTDRSGGGEPLSARSARSARSTHSQMSRASSMKSDDFSVADSQATPGGDFKIELKNAVLSIEPSSGVIPPHTTMTVNILSKAGKTPQRVRGMIESRIFDVDGKHELSKQYLNLRGEVQSPKVLLYPQHHNFGQVYVGRIIPFEFTLENICNLPTKFKFLRPGGQSSFFNFTLDPMKGSLDAKEKLIIKGSFTSLTTGFIDDLLSCKLFGISTPLGVNLKAVSKGISLEFINMKDGEDITNLTIPQPIASPDDAQYPVLNEKPPDPRPVEPIFLGHAVPLYERRRFTFFMRNLSAIPAPFEIQPRKFKVVEKKKRFGTRGGAAMATGAGGPTSSLGPVAPGGAVAAPASIGGGGGLTGVSPNKDVATVPPLDAAAAARQNERKGSKHSISTASITTVNTTSTVTTVARGDLYIAPHEDGTNKFQSEAGKKYIAFELNRREDRKYLKSGLGASYFMDVTSGILPAWGVQQVNIYAFNDIPGCYDDDIEISIRENEVIRKFAIPIKMNVIGCPIVIEKHTMGMTEKPLSLILPQSPKNIVQVEGEKQQLLQLGQVCEHGNLLKRHFIVKNYGSKDAKIKWNIRGIAAKANGPIKISLNYLNQTNMLEKKRKNSSINIHDLASNYRIKTSIRFWDDIAKESPFQIEPAKAVLPPYEKQVFTVLLNHNTPARMEKAVLTANIVIEDAVKKSDSSPVSVEGGSRILNVGGKLESEVLEKTNTTTVSIVGIDEEGSRILPKSVTSATTSSTSISAANKLKFELKLFVEGKYLHPELIIDKHTHSIPHNNTLVPDHHGLRLTAKSTLLFTSSSTMADVTMAATSMMTVNPICSKLINITNPLDSEVVIHVATEGALLIKDYEEPKDPSDLYENLNKKEKKMSDRGDRRSPSSSPSRAVDGMDSPNSPGSKHIKFEDGSPSSKDEVKQTARSGITVTSIKSQKNPQKEGKVLRLLPHVSFWIDLL